MIWLLCYCMLSFLIFSYELIPFLCTISYIMWWWLMSCDLLSYAISRSSQDLLLLMIPMISLIFIDSYAFILLPLSPTPYPYNWGYTHFHCDTACRPHILHICFMPFFHIYFTLSFYASYIIDCMYTHVIFYLLLKGYNSQQGTHSSFLVYPPRKKWQAR